MGVGVEEVAGQGYSCVKGWRGGDVWVWGTVHKMDWSGAGYGEFAFEVGIVAIYGYGDLTSQWIMDWS